MKLFGKKTIALVLALAMMLSCSVSVFAANDPDKYNIEYELPYTGDSDDDRVDLEELIYDELAYEYDWDNDVELEYYDIWTDDDDYEVYDEDLDYGKINSKDVYIVDLTASDEDDLYEIEELYENYIYYDAEDSDGYEYYGRIRIIIVDEGDYDYDYDLDEDLIYEIDYETELDLGSCMIEDLEILMKDDLDYVEFTIPTNAGDCGEIYYYYATNQWEALDDTKNYYAYPGSNEAKLAEVYFESYDEGGEYWFEYKAVDEDEDVLEGTVTISCGASIVVEVDIDADEIYEFDPEDFVDAVEEWDDDYELNYIEGVKLENSRDGELVDVAGKDVSTKTEYYVDDDEDDLIEEIIFEPSSRASDVIISFTANVQRGSKKAEDVAGMLKINVGEAADITIKAGVGDLIDIDWEIFQEYLEEDTDSTKYDVAYVTIKDAPRSDNDGYLVTDGEELKTKGEKTFYIDPAKKQYDLEDLQYQAGEKKGTYKATFKVYYYKTSSSTTATASTEGTIKFDVTAITSITTTTPLKASQVMSFMYELGAIKSLGGNNNVYIKFDSLPINGKLIYNFGTADQQDVTVGKEYYLNGETGKLQLSKVTYVPRYSTSKVLKSDTLNIQCFNQKGNGIKCTINIAVQYAQYSAQFTDVKDSKYADSVDYLYNQKITTGMTATTFGLTENVTRGQFVTFLYRAAGSPAVTGVTNKFTDVKPADYYYNAVLWAVKNGITSGRSDTIFDPAANVTHQEMATFLYRYDVNYLGHTGAFGSASYITDFSSVDSWAQNPVKWASNKGIIDYGAMQPKVAGTRATVALWLHRMLTL